MILKEKCYKTENKKLHDSVIPSSYFSVSQRQSHTSLCFLTGTAEISLKRIYKKLHLTPKNVILAKVVMNSSAIRRTERRLLWRRSSIFSSNRKWVIPYVAKLLIQSLYTLDV